MAIERCYINSKVLPINFTYKWTLPTIANTLKTQVGTVVQVKDYDATDFALTFNCEKADLATTGEIESLYLLGNSTTFVDLNGTSWTVIITEYSFEEVGGEYNLSGRMQVA